MYIGSDAFKNTNQAAIYLEGRTSVPSTFDNKWNISKNPVYLNGNLCGHENVTNTHLGSCLYEKFCNICKTIIGSYYSHDYGAPYIPLYSPYGIKKHYSTCSVCLEQKEMPCIAEFTDPNEDIYCLYCGQLIMPRQGMLYSVTMPNGKVYISTMPITYETFTDLAKILGYEELKYSDYKRLTESIIIINNNGVLKQMHMIVPKEIDLNELIE